MNISHIYLGNTTILRLCDIWRTMIDYCHHNNACIGMSSEWDDLTEEAIESQLDMFINMRNLSIDDVSDENE